MLTLHRLSLAAFAVLFSVATALTTPPAGALLVSTTAQGTAKVYKTLQTAVDALTDKASEQIFIYPGTYRGQTLINARKHPLTIFGYSKSDASYLSNQVLLTNNLSAIVAGSDDKSGTLRVHTIDFALYNVNVQNEFVGQQAIALSAQADRQAYYGCQLIGFQDTVYTNRGHHYFGHTYIEGAIDYIFGQASRAYFQKCDIRSVRWGHVTASGVSAANNTGVYVFSQCTLDKKVGSVVKDGDIRLGRPWGDYAKVVFETTFMSAAVDPVGWEAWSSTQSTAHFQFYEYQNTGPGSSMTKRQFSRVLKSTEVAQYTLNATLETTSWVDTKFT